MLNFIYVQLRTINSIKCSEVNIDNLSQGKRL